MFVLLAAIVSCTTTPEVSSPTPTVASTPTASRVAVAPPLLAPDGKVRFTTIAPNEVRAEDTATGAVRWTLPISQLAGSATTHYWRLLLSHDGGSLYVQSLAEGQSPTYLGTRRVDARTGVELANDIKFEIYWYENVVLWTALAQDGPLLMAVERPAAAGGGFWLRTFDPLTLKMLTDVRQAAPPPPLSAPRT